MKTLLYILTLCVLIAHPGLAEEIVPSAKQTKLLRGTLKQAGTIRTVAGEPDSTGHGPITYYHVPFREGAFSASWKVEVDQVILFVFDGAPQGKATHLLKVYVNGGPGGTRRQNNVTLITYDGSTKAKKKAKVVRKKHYSKPNEWHQISVSFTGEKATIVIDGKKFTATSARFSEGIDKIGVGHFTGELQTKDVKILKTKP